MPCVGIGGPGVRACLPNGSGSRDCLYPHPEVHDFRYTPGFHARSWAVHAPRLFGGVRDFHDDRQQQQWSPLMLQHYFGAPTSLIHVQSSMAFSWLVADQPNQRGKNKTRVLEKGTPAGSIASTSQNSRLRTKVGRWRAAHLWSCRYYWGGCDGRLGHFL